MRNQKYNGPIINFVSAPCGSGKTHAAANYIRDHSHETNFIYVAPSLALIAETTSLLGSLGVTPTVITSETHAGHVKKGIVDHLNASFESGDVAMVTWNAYVDLPFENNFKSRQVIIDEIPQLDRLYAWKLPRNLRFVTEYLELDEGSANDEVARVHVTDRLALQKRLGSERDDVDELFREFFRDLLSPNKDMFVDIVSWNRLVDNKSFSNSDEANCLFFISMLKPRPFRDSILLGANVEDSLVYHWLTRFHDCKFVEHEQIKAGLRKFPDDIGSRLKVSYFIPQRHSSKTLYKHASSSGKNLVDEMDRLALETFGSSPFLYVSNKDRKSSALDSHDRATPIPVISNGLNKYGSYSNIYFSAALNRQPKHFKILRSLGFEAQNVHTACSHEIQYQCVMRTSLRDPDSTAVVHAIVPDEPSAKRLAGLIGTSEVHQLGALHTPPRKPLTPTQKSRNHEAKKARDALSVPKSQLNSYIEDFGMGFGAVLDGDQSRRSASAPLASLVDPSNFDLDSDEAALDEPTGGNDPTCFVTFHTEAEAYKAEDFFVHSMQIGDFVALLRQQAGAVIKKKSEKLFFNPCVFVPPPGADGYRRLEYFKRSSLLVLDFDGGNLSPEKFASIFWRDAGRGKKRSFVICNSFDRSAEDPNKFRVILFYERPATSLEQHKAVYAAIVARLEEHGFTAESAKLDPQCKSGLQSFYLPCTNADHPKWAFFIAYGTKTRDLERCAIDPVTYGKTTVLSRPMNITFRTNDASGPSREKIDEAVAHLRSLTTGRHRAVFGSAMNLCRLGLCRTEVEAELHQVVGSETKMKKKVADALRYLAKHHWFSRDARAFSQAAFAGSPQANTISE